MLLYAYVQLLLQFISRLSITPKTRTLSVVAYRIVEGTVTKKSLCAFSTDLVVQACSQPMAKHTGVELRGLMHK